MNLFIGSLIAIFLSLDVFVPLRLIMLLRPVRNRRLWRGIVAVLGGSALGFCIILLMHRTILGSSRGPLPRWFVASLFIWHFLILPLLSIGLFFDLFVRAGRAIWNFVRMRGEQKPAEPISPIPESILSRRYFLLAAAVTVPPVATVSLAGIAMAQLGKFRIKPYDLIVAGWPAELDGYTITVIADVHVGAFSTQKMLDDIAEASNQLRSNLVLLAGDLVNISLADLPSGLDMVQRLDSRDGIYMIEGNHDVIEGADRFDRAVRRRGVDLLTDQVVTVNARGVPFQLLGTVWTNDDFRDESVSDTAALREPGVFAMMLAHHPHSWDAAAAAGIPLVISGHTHGGQIMLTDHIGGGPLRFKYWSGLYQKPNSQLIVSNGLGNWFPLSVGAPAEILKLTLHPKI